MPELYPEQKQAVEWVLDAYTKRKSVIIADRMGIYGKTASAIELCKRSGGIKLIIVPTYTIYNWQSEMRMWGIPDEDVCICDQKNQVLSEKEFYLIGYSRVKYETYITPKSGQEKKRPNFLMRQLLAKKFSLAVFDEAHVLTGWNTQQARLILGNYQNVEKNVLFRSEHALLLTGTPFKNRIEEIYSIIIRIAPDVLDHMSKYAFYQTYAGWLENNGFALIAHGVKHEEELKKRLAPVILRRTYNPKLIPRMEEDIYLDPNAPKLKKLFTEEETFLRDHGIDPDDISGLSKLTKVDISQIAAVRTALAISKIPAALELMETIREEQDTPAPVIFYVYHRATLAAVKNALEAKYPKLTTAYIEGGTDAKVRHDICANRFQKGKIDILVATIGALQVGVNLTAGRDIIFLELDFVPSNLDQAICRFDRNGQTGTVHVRRLVFNAGIEKRILKILAEKTTTIEKIIGK